MLRAGCFLQENLPTSGGFKRIPKVRLLPILPILFLVPFCVAQEPVAIKVDVSLVNVAFIVRDGSGALAAGLTKDDIELY